MRINSNFFINFIFYFYLFMVSFLSEVTSIIWFFSLCFVARFSYIAMFYDSSSIFFPVINSRHCHFFFAIPFPSNFKRHTRYFFTLLYINKLFELFRLISNYQFLSTSVVSFYIFFFSKKGTPLCWVFMRK